MLQKYLREIFNEDSTIGTDCIETAREIGYLLSPEKQQILNMLTQTQVMYGLTTDNQIIRKAISDARKYVKNDILQRFEEIVNNIKKSSATRAKLYLMFNEERNRKYLAKKADYEELIKFVRGDSYLDISTRTQDSDLDEVNAIIQDIEEEKDKYPEAYMTRRALYKTPSEFYIDLFEKTLSSIDHVVPKSKGGSDTRRNFLAVCRGCNEKKGSTPLPVFMAADSKITPNIEHHIKFLRASVPKYVAERKLSREYLTYPDEISENLQEITNGTLNLIG